MTLQEAINSGENFRRKGWDEVYKSQHVSAATQFTVSDILSTDWELVDVEFVITKEQLAKAWNEIIVPRVEHGLPVKHTNVSIMFRHFCSQLLTKPKEHK